MQEKSSIESSNRLVVIVLLQNMHLNKRKKRSFTLCIIEQMQQRIIHLGAKVDVTQRLYNHRCECFPYAVFIWFLLHPNGTLSMACVDRYWLQWLHSAERVCVCVCAREIKTIWQEPKRGKMNSIHYCSLSLSHTQSRLQNDTQFVPLIFTVSFSNDPMMTTETT